MGYCVRFVFFLFRFISLLFFFVCLFASFVAFFFLVIVSVLFSFLSLHMFRLSSLAFSLAILNIYFLAVLPCNPLYFLFNDDLGTPPTRRPYSWKKMPASSSALSMDESPFEDSMLGASLAAAAALAAPADFRDMVANNLVLRIRNLGCHHRPKQIGFITRVCLCGTFFSQKKGFRSYIFDLCGCVALTTL